jgi:hypothetical protein
MAFYSYEKVGIFQIEITPFSFYNKYKVNMHVAKKEKRFIYEGVFYY